MWGQIFPTQKVEQKKIERGRQTIFQSRLKNLIEKDSFWFRLEFFKNIFCFWCHLLCWQKIGFESRHCLKLFCSLIIKDWLKLLFWHSVNTRIARLWVKVWFSSVLTNNFYDCFTIIKIIFASIYQIVFVLEKGYLFSKIKIHFMFFLTPAAVDVLYSKFLLNY